MSVPLKEFVSLLTSVVAEICDDSDEEDLLPNNLFSEFSSVSKDTSDYEPVLKVMKKGPKTKSVSREKFTKLSRFEDKDILILYLDNDEELCDKSLRPTRVCFCVDHFIDDKTIGWIDEKEFNLSWKIQFSTMEKIYKLINRGVESPCVTPLQFLAVIWSFTTAESLDLIESRFKISKELIPGLERTVMDEIIQLKNYLIRWPTRKTAEVTQEMFNKASKLPNALAAVDLVHFPCNAMPYAGNYINQNGDKTVLFLLAVDHSGRFTFSSYFWWPGKFSTVSLIKDSPIRCLPGPEGSYLVGSSHFSTVPRFITPIIDSEAVCKPEKNFNAAHSKVMETLHKAVFSFASRFSTATFLKTQTPWLLRKQFLALILLHNICVDLEDIVEIDPKLTVDAFFPQSLFLDDKIAEDKLRKLLCAQLT